MSSQPSPNGLTSLVSPLVLLPPVRAYALTERRVQIGKATRSRLHQTKRTVDDVLKDLFDPVDTEEMAFMIQIILRDLSPLLYSPPSSSGVVALREYNTLAYHQVPLYEAMAAWHPRMPSFYEVVADLDFVSGEVERPNCKPFPCLVAGRLVTVRTATQPSSSAHREFTRTLVASPRKVHPSELICNTCRSDPEVFSSAPRAFVQVPVVRQHEGWWARLQLKQSMTVNGWLSSPSAKCPGPDNLSKRLQIHIDMDLTWERQIKIFSKSGRDSTHTRSKLLPYVRIHIVDR